MMSKSRVNYTQPEEVIFKNYCEKLAERYRIPEVNVVEADIKKICELGRNKNYLGLEKYVDSREIRFLQYEAARLIARTGDESIIDTWIEKFPLDSKSIAEGCAWGGHLKLLQKMDASNQAKLRGFALGRHIEYVNQLLNEDNSLIDEAYSAYKQGGHVKVEEEVLELMALTTSTELRKRLAKGLKQFNDSIDEPALLDKANKIAILIDENKIQYSNEISTSSREAWSLFKKHNSIEILNELTNRKKM